MRNLIGLVGAARAGKDTVAMIMGRWNYTQTAFAAPLKKAAMVIFGLTPEQVYGDTLKEKPDTYWGVTPREIMQKLGTECMRNGFADDVWIRSMERTLLASREGRLWVITDVRFPNEANFVRNAGGALVHIIRPGHVGAQGGVPGHPSEQPLPDFKPDAVIVNDSTVTNLIEKTRVMLETLPG